MLRKVKNRKQDDTGGTFNVLPKFIFSVIVLSAVLLAVFLLLTGCKSVATCMDGTILQVNEYTGLTIGHGNARSIPANTEYFEQTELVTTSWFNSMAKDYRRITIWASPFTNCPPEYLAESFLPNVDTRLVYSTVTNGDSVLHYIKAVQSSRLKPVKDSEDGK